MWCISFCPHLLCASTSIVYPHLCVHSAEHWPYLKRIPYYCSNFAPVAALAYASFSIELRFTIIHQYRFDAGDHDHCRPCSNSQLYCCIQFLMYISRPQLNRMSLENWISSYMYQMHTAGFEIYLHLAYKTKSNFARICDTNSSCIVIELTPCILGINYTAYSIR